MFDDEVLPAFYERDADGLPAALDRADARIAADARPAVLRHQDARRIR